MTNNDANAKVVRSVDELGILVRSHRESLGGLRIAAPRLNVGVRFLSELERGKETAAIGKVLSALHGLKLDLAVIERPVERQEPLSKLIGTEFPYDWSNPHMDASLFIRKVLEQLRFNDVLKTVDHFGYERVLHELPHISQRAKAASLLTRIFTGMTLAYAHDDSAS